MKKQRQISQIVGFVLIFSLLSTALVSCRLDSGPRLTFNSVSPSSSSVGQPITVTVYMNGQNDEGAFGTVLITADTSCTATLVDEIGSCQVVFTSGGMRIITADYSGDKENGSERAVQNYYVVAPLTPTPVALTRISIISYKPSNPRPGELIEFKFRVNAIPDVGTFPTGTVTLSSVDGFGCTSSLSTNGEGMCSAAFSTPGFKTVTADYHGGEGWAPGRTEVDISVIYATQITLSTVPNPPVAEQPFLVEANVSVVNGGPIPSGTVTIGTCYVALVAGVGTCQLVFSEAGEQKIIASFSADGDDAFNYQQSSAELTVTVKPRNTYIAPPADTGGGGGGGGAGCMVAANDTFTCVVPCPNPDSYPEVCTGP